MSRLPTFTFPEPFCARYDTSQRLFSHSGPFQHTLDQCTHGDLDYQLKIPKPDERAYVAVNQADICR